MNEITIVWVVSAIFGLPINSYLGYIVTFRMNSRNKVWLIQFLEFFFKTWKWKTFQRNCDKSFVRHRHVSANNSIILWNNVAENVFSSIVLTENRMISTLASQHSLLPISNQSILGNFADVSTVCVYLILTRNTPNISNLFIDMLLQRALIAIYQPHYGKTNNHRHILHSHINNTNTLTHKCGGNQIDENEKRIH